MSATLRIPGVVCPCGSADLCVVQPGDEGETHPLLGVLRRPIPIKAFCCADHAQQHQRGNTAAPTTKENIMLLDDTDLDTETETETAAVAETGKADRRRSRSRIDAEAGTVTVLDAQGVQLEQYSIEGVPDHVRAYLALTGLWATLRAAKDPEATLASLRAGDIPGRTEAGLAGARAWREAYALALHEQRRAPLHEAREKAASLSKEELAKIKTHPLVVSHWSKLTGASDELV